MQPNLTMHSINPNLGQEHAMRRRPACAAQAMASDSVESLDLLRGQKTVEIRHNGAVYRLQATRLGKLILTK